MVVNPLSSHTYTISQVSCQKTEKTYASAALNCLDRRQAFESVKSGMLTLDNIRNNLYDCLEGCGSFFWGEGISSLTSQILQQEGKYDFGKVTDPQFINNFVVKEEFYRDEIKENFQGQELTDRLARFDEVVDKVRDRLAQKFAQYVGDFFNGEVTWQLEGDTVYKEIIQESNPPEFSVAAFKEQIIQTMKNQQKAFQTIKQQNADQWQAVLETGGVNIELFGQELETFAAEAGNSSLQDLEHMSYTDMRAVAGAIKAMNIGISTNSEEILASYLGQAEAKVELYLRYTSMSSALKERIRAAVNKNITIKIKCFSLQREFGRLFWQVRGSTEQIKDYLRSKYNEQLNFKGKAGEIFNAFAALGNSRPKNFMQTFLEGINKLNESLLEPTPEIPGVAPGEYVSYDNKLRFARDIIDQQAQDWNSFIDTLKIDANLKKNYYVPASNRNLLDVTV